MTLDIRPLVAYGVDDPDQFALIRGEGAMAGHDEAVEEGNRVLVLDEYYSKTMGGRAAL